MTHGIMGGMLWGCLLIGALLLGFAYIIWIFANKERPGLKITGQIVAAVIAITAIVLVLHCILSGGSLRHSCGKFDKEMMLKMHSKMMLMQPETGGLPQKSTKKETK